MGSTFSFLNFTRNKSTIKESDHTQNESTIIKESTQAHKKSKDTLKLKILKINLRNKNDNS